MDHCGHCCPSDFFRPCRRRGKTDIFWRKSPCCGKQHTIRYWPPVEIMEVSPADLLSSYEANEVKGDALYEGKTMRLSGTVGSIGKDVMEEVYITFAGEEFAITSVQCYFSDEAQIEKVMELQEGDAITLVGVCDGKFGNVLIKDCVFE